jgi:hypothetical protein
MEEKTMSQTNMPRLAVLREVRTSLANWLTGVQHLVEEETGKRYSQETAAMISGNTVQGALVDINRLTVKIQQIFVEHPELQEQFGAVAA